VIAQRLQVRQAESALRLARRQIVPDVAIGAGYAQQGSAGTAITPPTVTLDVALTLPIFYQQKGEITMAQSNLRTQQVSLAKLEAQVLSDVDIAYSAFKAA